MLERLILLIAHHGLSGWSGCLYWGWFVIELCRFIFQRWKVKLIQLENMKYGNLASINIKWFIKTVSIPNLDKSKGHDQTSYRKPNIKVIWMLPTQPIIIYLSKKTFKVSVTYISTTIFNQTHIGNKPSNKN